MKPPGRGYGWGTPVPACQGYGGRALWFLTPDQGARLPVFMPGQEGGHGQASGATLTASLVVAVTRDLTPPNQSVWVILT